MLLLTKCKTSHNNNIWECNKDSENNKTAQFMFTKTTLIQTNMDKIITITLAV